MPPSRHLKRVRDARERTSGATAARKTPGGQTAGGCEDLVDDVEVEHVTKVPREARARRMPLNLSSSDDEAGLGDDACL